VPSVVRCQWSVADGLYVSHKARIGVVFSMLNALCFFNSGHTSCAVALCLLLI